MGMFGTYVQGAVTSPFFTGNYQKRNETGYFPVQFYENGILQDSPTWKGAGQGKFPNTKFETGRDDNLFPFPYNV